MWQTNAMSSWHFDLGLNLYIHTSLHIALVTKEISILDLWGFPDTLFHREMTDIKTHIKIPLCNFLVLSNFKFSLLSDWYELLINHRTVN